MTESLTGRHDGHMTQPALTRSEHQTRPSNVPDGVLTTVRRKDRLIAGVCSGLATRYNVDPLLVRVAFVLLGLSLGVGIVLYAFCAAWMIDEDATEPWIHQQVPRSRTWPWSWVMAALVVVSIIMMVTLGAIFPFGLGPAVILLGVWLWARHARHKAENRPMVYFPTAGIPGTAVHGADTSQQQPVTHFDAASMAWRSRLEAVYLSNDPLPPAPPDPQPVLDLYHPEPEPAATPARKRSGRRPSWVATLGMWVVASLAFGGTYLLAPEFTTTDAEYRWLLPSVAALAVIGLFLLVGAVTRRPHLAIISGLVVALTMFTSLATPYLTPIGPSGTQSYSAAAPIPAQIDIRYRTTTLDFSQVEMTHDQTITVTATASSITVIPPSSAVINYVLEGAVLKHQGTDAGGGTDTGTLDLRQAGAPTLTITLTARAAEVIIP